MIIIEPKIIGFNKKSYETAPSIITIGLPPAGGCVTPRSIIRKIPRPTATAICKNRSTSMEDRFEAQLKLSEMPRNGAKTRLRNRCLITGRPRGYYRKVKMSRIALRELALSGQIPGMVKSSW